MRYYGVNESLKTEVFVCKSCLSNFCLGMRQAGGRPRSSAGGNHALRPPMIVFGCSHYPDLSKSVCDILGITEGNVSITHPSNKETDVAVCAF